MGDMLTGLGQPNGQQPIPDFHNLPQGQDKQLQDAARSLPLPAESAPGGVTGLAALADPNHPARAEALRHPPMDLLRPSERPHEPDTSGLPTGPGPGPEAIGIGAMPRVAGVIDALAARTGNPVLASLAAEAAASNL